MSSPPPEHGSSPDEALFASDPDADTGPVRVVWPDTLDTSVAPTSYPGQEYYPQPVEDSYANRFTAPLTVDPRATKVKSIGIQPKTLFAVGGAVVLAAALVLLLINLFGDSGGSGEAAGETPRKAQPADQQRLETILPQGYSDTACAPIDPPSGALAKVSCSANSDPGGPPSATYTLVADTSALRTTFDGIVGAARQVNCPGNIQSPGPWRRNAAPDVVAGTVFCGFRQDVPTVAWTDDAKLMVASVDGAAAGPNLDLVYTWWRGHL